jgi:hypothetical protein
MVESQGMHLLLPYGRRAGAGGAHRLPLRGARGDAVRPPGAHPAGPAHLYVKTNSKLVLCGCWMHLGPGLV